MSIENRLTVSELGNVGDMGRVRLTEISSLETTVSGDFDEVVKHERSPRRTYYTGIAIGALVTLASSIIPLALQETEIALIVGPPATLGLGSATVLFALSKHNSLKAYNATKVFREKAKKLTEKGYISVPHLPKGSIVLPSVVGGVEPLYYIGSEGFLGLQVITTRYAIKEQGVSAPVIALAEVGEYVGKTVIVPVQITTVGDYSDMKLSARGELCGTMGGIFPLRMSGTIDGRVFTEDVSFRIGDSEGNSISIPVYLGYLAPHLKEQLPLELRSYSPVTRNVTVVDKTALVNFLNEALNNKRQLTLLGKLDNAGNFNMEALADGRTKQVYALAVYQPR